ncbi:response regulator transcription factor [Nocardia sp. XZ_19_385]|uniref:response regulator transcription factor n=1 Tax=Nocardia sp. XZ_19_385 TaxID=2769488 RepID=UPI00188FE3C9|nr:response regulator transcription factor [Nocardia sp. XZ_19_385]
MSDSLEAPRVLVVDDDPNVREALGDALSALDHYRVERAADGLAALKILDNHRVDAVVLDLTMPRLDGSALCRRLRAAGDSTPILILTARDTTADRIQGLDDGADDYLGKPYDLGELRARVRALLRRAPNRTPEDPSSIELGDLLLNPQSRQATRAGAVIIQFTMTEFAVLELLARNTGLVLSRDTIAERVWGGTLPQTSNAIDVYIRYLRQKLDAAECPPLIHTVRGVGYQVRVP